MKAFLMHRDRDFDFERQLPANEETLIKDLALDILFNAMALGDQFLSDVAKTTLLSEPITIDTILYRQNILRDCLKNPVVVRNIYDIACESLAKKNKHYYNVFTRYPGSILHSSIEIMQMFADYLKRLKGLTEEHADRFESEGFARFFTMITRELTDEYLDTVQDHLERMKFRNGVLIGTELGRGNEGANYMLCKPRKKQRWIKRIFTKKPIAYTFSIHPRDHGGMRVLSELKDKGINLIANTLAQSADHINSFFSMLRGELAFYVGCLNLHEQLTRLGGPISFPIVPPFGERTHSFRGLYDLCLALTMKRQLVGNDVSTDNKDLVIITGANQGGKSTFLRSIGLAQLMMQCGMFTPAECFCSHICDGLFTHYKREEDAAMNSGKLDEELSRMNDIIDQLTPHAMVLFNESFAATNEREGSEVAKHITRALLEKRIKIFFVTHLYEFPRGFYDKKMKATMFLRAERQNDGKRTFNLIEGKPLKTSYGEDLYNSIFRTDT
jgi:hypothetical protein